MRKLLFLTAVIIPALIACTGNRDLRHALGTINEGDLRRITREIGSDSMMGRAPFTGGEEAAVKYLSGELAKIGFKPAFSGSYYQEVPLIRITSHVEGDASFDVNGKALKMTAPDDIAIVSTEQKALTDIENMPLVFCGFGIVAPEYNWNDYKNADVKGKCAVVLVNDPGLYTGDTSLFRGRTMTYYGRWTYKYEEAARQGAAAVLIVHETKGAGYDFSIQRNSSIAPKFYMQSDGGSGQCILTGWINDAPAAKLFAMLGQNIDSLRMKACKRGFAGFDMKTRLKVKITNTILTDKSRNVAGILPGSKKPEEAIVISAHWDHFGIGEKVNGDSIYNGTVDNGTSIAWALEMGKAFSSLKNRPARSVIILFPTCEEEGLLGSTYFIRHSPVKTSAIAAAFNNDMMLPEGRMKDMMITGYGQSDLEDILAEVVKRQDRYIQPDPTPETGMYFRSDHFPFAQAGIPALFARGNCDSREHGKEWAAAKEKEYLKNCYHKPADNYNESMDFSGIREDAQAIFEVAREVADGDVSPQWKKGSEFASVRKK